MALTTEELRRILSNNPDLSTDIDALDTMRGRRKPSPDKPTEHDMQVAVIAKCNERAKQDPLWKLIFAIPNGGQRSKGVAGKLKAEGVKAGVLDLFLPVARHNFHGLFIELKAGDNDLTFSQSWWIEQLTEQGYLCDVVWDDPQQVIDLIDWYLCQ